MPYNQHAQFALPQQTVPLRPSRATPVDISQMDVGISQLLGYDYVFVSGDFAMACFSQQHTAISAMTQLITQLGLRHDQTVFISVQETASGEIAFCRHDAMWKKQQVTQLTAVQIGSEEQQEFMKMIWQCSSQCSINPEGGE